MNKFEGIIKKVAGYDSHEVRDKDKIEIRKDIRDRSIFPAEIQNILSQLDKLETEETLVKNSIQKQEENIETVNYDLLNDLRDQLQKIEDRKDSMQQDLLNILSKDKELHDKFMEYVSKKADKENLEELKFSAN